MKEQFLYEHIQDMNMKEEGTKITSVIAKILHRQTTTAHTNLNAVTTITYFIFTSFTRIPR
ncbi:hypothetical protein WN55_03050 [Dufourea novaeangliae]|uniref:Uncharacterized protein n=1 Tax=Dufourea novaeangliae TaxID=178035 RepID=A0A154PI03_DUFNO|nr:hypothetical protein WN55_03050 [Dufourea novaeangliae]